MEIDETIIGTEQYALEYGYNYPVLPMMIEVRKNAEEVFEESSSLKKKLKDGSLGYQEMEDFYQTVEQSGRNNAFHHKNLLLTFGHKKFGLKEKEITNRITRFDSITYEDIESLHDLKTKFSTKRPDNILPLLSGWEVDFAMQSYQQINDLNTYLGCRRMISLPYQPIVFSEQYAVKKGEKFNAQISIGNYVTYLKPEDVVFELNGDTLLLDSSGITPISLVADEIGKNILDMNCQIRNPFTGEVREYSSTYHHEVLTK